MKKVILEKLSTLVIGALALVAALTWNDTVKALLVEPCGTEGAGVLCSLSAGALGGIVNE